jgi:acyl CoA:acetate/3-ketoacid CoA transferase
VDLERDVLAQMDFRPVLADRVAVMPASHFTAEDDGFGSLARRA